MSIAPAIFDWLGKYNIKSLLNTPCGSRDDCKLFRAHGIERIVGVNIREEVASYPGHVVGDLCDWKPDGEWDAAYSNCFFCTSNDSRIGDHAAAAKNIASWPVRYIVFYDTPVFEWMTYFEQAGWKRIEYINGMEGGMTRAELWSKW